MSSLKNFLLKIIKNPPENQKELEKLKRKWLKKVIPNTEILKFYQKLVKNKEILRNKNLETILRKRKVRTLSGVAVIAIFTKPYPCPGHCLYCPTQKNSPKSYLKNEPAMMRAILCNYNPALQIKTRLETLAALGHPTDKIELIVMGGTFSALPRLYQLEFIIQCFKTCNNPRLKNSKFQFLISKQISNSKFLNNVNNVILSDAERMRGEAEGSHKLNFKTLKVEQKKNGNAKHRIIGLTLETRPDYINENEIKWMRILGATRIELGVQSIYDDVLKFNTRGHLVGKTIYATKFLKDAGFKINYHIMPNLPKSTPLRDLKMFYKLFHNQNFQPDMLKIYPCVLTKNAPKLARLWKEKKYKPYSDRQLINLLIKIKQQIPKYCRIMRLGRDIPATSILVGSKISNIREVVAQKMKEKKLKCRCIRCREIKNQITNNNQQITIKRFDYWASDGKEIFLSYEDLKNDKLIAFLRLRIPSFYFSGTKHFLPKLQNAALIREIHTYGQMVEIGKKINKAVQHFGFGKKLVAQAEKIAAKEFKIKKIAVISGVGVRNFWRKLGYKLQNTYMTKQIIC
ncbi:MAG: tRNA uridine(34) 5-carboxymethylaminomethyl modification radical SAM/GNAT enzyme Elp3 [Patescibacteria group bacterium]